MKIAKYQSIAGANCLLASFTNGIKILIRNVEESKIFFLQNGFKISFELKTEVNEKEEKELTLRFSHHFDKIIEGFMDQFNIKYSKDNTWGNADEFIQFLIRRFSDNWPFLMFVNLDNLNHSSNRSYISNKFRLHAVNLIGISDAGIIISDCFVPTFPVTVYEGILDFNKFYEIFEWNKKNLGHQCYNIDYGSIDTRALDIPASDLKKALNTNLESYFNVKYEYSYLNALNKFCEELVNIFNVPNVGEKLVELGYKIFTESIIPARQLLKEALILLNNDRIINLDLSLITELHNNIVKWYNITFQILKAGFRCKKENFEKIYEKVKMHIHDEEKLFSKIYDITSMKQ